MTVYERHEAGKAIMCMNMATRMMMCRCTSMRIYSKSLPGGDVNMSCFS